MIEVFKLVHNDSEAAVKLNFNILSTTRRNVYKLQKFTYNLRKYSFCSTVVNIILNSLPNEVVEVGTINNFENQSR